MPGKFTVTFYVAVGLTAACGGSISEVDPHPTAVTPGVGQTRASTSVTIRGDGFLARLIQPAGGGAPTQYTQHRAWVSGVALQDVTWVDAQTLTATVPAGLPIGSHTLIVENTFGRRGQLEQAFAVQQPAVLTAVVAAPSSAAVSRDLTVAMTVTNPGGSEATAVAPTALTVSGSTSAALKTGAAPASTSIPAGGKAEFSWIYTAGGTSGTIRFAGGAAGKDAVTGETVTAPAATSGQVTVGYAALSATISATPSTVNVGRTVTVTLTLSNPGTAAVGNISPTVPVIGGVTATLLGGPSPATVASLLPGRTTTFTWQYQASTAGQLTILASASGTDAISGGQVVGIPVTSAQVTVQTPAELAITAFGATPSTASTGQSFAVTLTVGRTGGSSAVISAVALGALANLSCGPRSGVTLPYTMSVASTTFTWNCSASAAGSYPVTATVTWADSNLGTSRSLSPASPFTVTVQAGAGLVVNSLVAAPMITGIGQPIGLTLTVGRTGGARVIVSAVTPSALSNLSCTEISETLPMTVSGSRATFTWSCVASVAGSYPLSATVTWADANTGVSRTSSLAAPTTVTVQAPAALAVTGFDAIPLIVNVGEAIAVSLTVNNAEGAGAVISAVTPAALTDLNCSSVSGPGLPLTLTGTSATFVWNCAAAAAGDYPLSVEVAWADANTSIDQTLAPAAPAMVTVQTAPN